VQLKSNERVIVDLAGKINLIRETNLTACELTYSNPIAEFGKFGIQAPRDLVHLYSGIVCCKESNHEGNTTRFVPIEEMVGYDAGFLPFYDQLNFCWTLYAKSDDGIDSKVYCEYEITENKYGKMEFTVSLETFLLKVVSGKDIFTEVNDLISTKYPRIKL
jgi:hypothetical protein